MALRREFVPLTTFQFVGAAGSTQEIQLIKYIPTEAYVSGLLEARVSARPSLAGQRIELALQPVSMAEDEPEALYTTTVGEVAVSISNGTTLPTLLTANLNTPVPSAYRLIVRGVQPVGVSSAFSATLSASLTLRES
jgi:hypothetical protein